MKSIAYSRCVLSFGIAAAALAACGGSQSPIGAPVTDQQTHAMRAGRHGSGSTPIQHVVLMIQENRTFNNLFAGFPGATGSKTGLELVPNPSGTGYIQKTINLAKVPLTDHHNPAHVYSAFLTGWDNGAMDAFNRIKATKNGLPEGKLPYQYVDPATIAPYWTIADQWGLADEMFQTQGSDSFAAHQDLIRGGTCISSIYSCANPSSSTISLIDSPTNKPWGCDAPPGTKTTVINGNLQVLKAQGPFPCSKDFADYGSSGYATLRDLLDAKTISWRYYTPNVTGRGAGGALWNAFDVIAPVRYGQEWTDGHISSPETNIFTDIQNGTLPAMSWVIPKGPNSDHPGYLSKDTGPSWIASVVNAVGNSQYWDSTAVIIVWDDWGGFYDPVAPPTPRDDQGGPGLRVPMLVVSPYIQIGTGSQGGYVSHTVYEFGSVIRFIEDTFNLGRLGTTDGSSTSMVDMFNFNQSPRPFVTIQSLYKRVYFGRQKQSDLPVDTE
jgi:phospholipase C